MERVATMDPVPEEEEQVQEPVQEEAAPEEAEEEALDPKEPLWDGGPTWEQIEDWKREHGDVYATQITPDLIVVWRTITRFEYRRLIKNMEQAVSTGQVSQAEANLNNEEAIAELCILFPKLNRIEMAGKLAGIPSIISQEVMQASAFEAMEVRQL